MLNATFNERAKGLRADTPSGARDIGRFSEFVGGIQNSALRKFVSPDEVPPRYRDPSFEVSIENVVCKCTLNVTDINLSYVSAAIGAEYNPTGMPKATVRYQDIPATVLVFSTGSVVCIGSRSKEKALVSVCRLCDELTLAMGSEVRHTHFFVCNLVASARYPSPIILSLLRMAYPERCTYDPDLFPGARFQHHESGVTFTVFGSGCVIFTGVYDVNTMHAAFLRICRIIEAFSERRVGHLQAIGTDRPSQVRLLRQAVEREADRVRFFRDLIEEINTAEVNAVHQGASSAAERHRFAMELKTYADFSSDAACIVCEDD